MSKYLVIANYSPDGVKGVLATGGGARKAAVASACEALGGSMESFYFGFGEADAYVVVDLPDNVAAAALAPFRPKWAAVLAAPYLGLLTVGSLSVAARLNTAEERLTAPLALAAMHLPWGLGFIEGLAGASQEQGPR